MVQEELKKLIMALHYELGMHCTFDLNIALILLPHFVFLLGIFPVYFLFNCSLTKTETEIFLGLKKNVCSSWCHLVRHLM